MLLDVWTRHPTACLAAACLVAVLSCSPGRRVGRGRLAHVPGPWHARWTDLVLLAHEAAVDGRTGYVHALHARYGPVVLVAPGEVSFSSPAAGRQIYHDRGVDKDGACYGAYAAYGRDNLFSTREDDRHGRRRRVVGNYYARSSLPVAAIEAEVERFVRAAAAAAGGRATVEVYSKVAALTLDVITAVVFRSTHAPVAEEDVRRAIADRANRDRVRFLRIRGHPSRRPPLRPPRPLVLAEGAGREGREEEDVITKILEAEDEKKGLFATLEAATGDRSYALSETRDHLIAGSDTTTTVLVMLLHHLAFHEDLQEVLFASLTQTDNIETDPVLDATLKEALRLWAPIPMSLPRISRTDKTVDGFLIPRETRMSSGAYSRHRLPHLFPDPETFSHERFLRRNGDNDDDDDADATIRAREAALWAFSSGTRVCIGKALAMLEMKLLVGRLILTHRLSPGKDLRRHLEMVENCESFGAGPGHRADIHLCFRQR